VNVDKAYLAWDRNPGNEQTCGQLETALREYAADGELTATQLRVRILLLRKQGMAPLEAVRAVCP
jgi:hypothetical protein